MLWRAGCGFVVRDLPWTVEQLRVIPPFEVENWAVIALGGIPNKVQVGDMGRRIFPVSASAAPRKQQEGELGLKERWYPIQVKQKMEALHLLKLKPKQNIGKWKAESPQNKPTLHGCHGVFSPRSRSLARRPLENPRAGICRTFIRKTKKRNYHFPAGIFNFSSSSPSRLASPFRCGSVFVIRPKRLASLFKSGRMSA